ncbi:MAG: aldo/keto reductase [Elusimicrobia bacterium RIFCSPLOWO2_12_FULL_59_9]|nr:MAG: aldo/keto reductase [Elusimicrobia bacterium RIFCSPLOWO2_12_FULL_59_9]
MHYRTLGKTGLAVSEIGFGAWGIGGSYWGKTDDAESLKALRAAFEGGVTFFDTAYVYGDGRSERLIAQALAGAGKKAAVATKIPPLNMRWPADPKTPLSEAFPPDWITLATERSLKNLDTDCIDLQQFHVWTDAWLKDPLWDKTFETLLRLKSAGKIRFWGVSINDHAPNSAVELAASGAADSVQVIFNLFDQSPEEKLLPLCREKGVGVIARCPFDEGSLAGLLSPATRFEPGDFRADYFAGARLSETLERVGRLKSALLENGSKNGTMAQAALKFCLSHAAVGTVIPGMRKTAHVAENIGSSDGRAFAPDALATLRRHAWSRNFYQPG